MPKDERPPPSDEEVLNEFLGEFLKDLARRVQGLQGARKDERFFDAIRLAHQIGGAAATFGFAKLSDHAKALEAALKSDSTPQLAEWDTLIAEAERVLRS